MRGGDAQTDGINGYARGTIGNCWDGGTHVGFHKKPSYTVLESLYRGGQKVIMKKNQNEGHEKEDDLVEDLPVAVKKIKLPYFDGTDPAGWISKAETFF